MKKSFSIPFSFLLIFILGNFNCYGAMYISLGSGSLEQEIDTFDTNLEVIKEGSKGNGAVIQLGLFMTNSIALELGYGSFTFEEYLGETTSPVLSYKLNPKLDIINYGLRWYVWEFLNFRFGGIQSTYDAGFVSEPVYDGIGSEKVSSSGTYYGMGLGLTFSKMQLFYDLTQIPKSSQQDSVLSEIGIRVFF